MATVVTPGWRTLSRRERSKSPGAGSNEQPRAWEAGRHELAMQPRVRGSARRGRATVADVSATTSAVGEGGGEEGFDPFLGEGVPFRFRFRYMGFGRWGRELGPDPCRRAGQAARRVVARDRFRS